jgi:hypothetical protein
VRGFDLNRGGEANSIRLHNAANVRRHGCQERAGEQRDGNRVGKGEPKRDLIPFSRSMLDRQYWEGRFLGSSPNVIGADHIFQGWDSEEDIAGTSVAAGLNRLENASKQILEVVTDWKSR